MTDSPDISLLEVATSIDKQKYPTSYHRGARVFDPRKMEKVASLNCALIFADLNMKHMERDGRAWREMGKIANLAESGTIAGELIRRELEGVLFTKNRLAIGEYLPCHVCQAQVTDSDSFDRITHAYQIGGDEVRETRRVHKACFDQLKVPYVETTQIVDRDGKTLIAPDGTPMAARGQMVRSS